MLMKKRQVRSTSGQLLGMLNGDGVKVLPSNTTAMKELRVPQTM